jgi:cell division transport system permease protein
VKHAGYFVREAIANVARGGVLTAAAVLAVTFAALIIGIFAVAYVNLKAVYADATREVVIDVYIRDEVSAARAEGIGEHLRRLDGVARAEYISKEKAAREFVGLFPQDKDILAAAGENPLPASYRVHLREDAVDERRIAALVKEINRVDGVEEAVWGQDWVGELERAANEVAWIGAAVGIVLGATAVLVVMSTIGLTVYARRDAISIMKVVGATDGFVQTPFVVEGLVIGLTGGVLAAVVLWGGVYALGQAELAVRFLPPIYLAAGLALTAAGGACGSFIAVRRFLKV